MVYKMAKSKERQLEIMLKVKNIEYALWLKVLIIVIFNITKLRGT
jgi:hypothetical protein